MRYFVNMKDTENDSRVGISKRAKKVKRSPTLRSGYQSFRSFGARNPAPNAHLKTIHSTDLRQGNSGAGVKKRARKARIEDLPMAKINDEQIKHISATLARRIDKDLFKEKYAPIGEVLKLIGTGIFIAGSFAIPTLPMALKPFLKNENEYEIWKRFNIPYLKRTLERLEKQKLVEIKEGEKYQTIEITQRGKRRILKLALEELNLEKPRNWDGKWRLVSYDIPCKYKNLGELFSSYLKTWNFFPLHKSLFIHAYPCEKQMEYLREYLGLGKFVRLFRVDAMENDSEFREFFGV